MLLRGSGESFQKWAECVSKSPTAALELKEKLSRGQFQPGAAVQEAHQKVRERVTGVEQYWMNNYVHGGILIILVCLNEKRVGN